jgi:hypothetical protein
LGGLLGESRIEDPCEEDGIEVIDGGKEFAPKGPVDFQLPQVYLPFKYGRIDEPESLQSETLKDRQGDVKLGEQTIIKSQAEVLGI